jgi:hypothetical protein
MDTVFAQRLPVARRIAYGALFAGSLAAAIAVSGAGTWQIWVFLVLPDVALLLGMERGLERGRLHPRAVPLYNALHRLAGPAALGIASIWLGPEWLAGALAWAAHIFIDRSVGYGFRSRDGYQA